MTWEEDFLSEMSQWLILFQLQLTLLLSTKVVSPYGFVGYIFMLLTVSLFFALSVIVAITMNQKIKHFLIKTMQRVYKVPEITEDYVKFVLGGIGKKLFAPENAAIKPISDLRNDQTGIYGEAIIDTMQHLQSEASVVNINNSLRLC